MSPSRRRGCLGTFGLLAIVIALVSGFLLLLVAALGSDRIARVNQQRRISLGAPLTEGVSVFPETWPATDAVRVGAPGYQRVRRHLEQDCQPETEGLVVAGAWLGEALRLGWTRQIWLSDGTGGYSHRLRISGAQVVVVPERGNVLVLHCGVDGATLEREVLDADP